MKRETSTQNNDPGAFEKFSPLFDFQKAKDDSRGIRLGTARVKREGQPRREGWRFELSKVASPEWVELDQEDSELGNGKIIRIKSSSKRQQEWMTIKV